MTMFRVREAFISARQKIEQRSREAEKQRLKQKLAEQQIAQLQLEERAQQQELLQKKKKEAEQKRQEQIAYQRQLEEERLKQIQVSSLSDKQKEIRKIIEKRGIKWLVHFTRSSNLKNILKNGLEGRDTLDNSLADYHYNDEWRGDKIENGICCSISFPNYKMFYKYRDEAEDLHHKWAVIVLDPSVLWKKDCLFFPYNAADNLITKNNKIYDLEALFCDLEGKNIKRASLPIPAHYTTDPQAEVIFTEKIDPSFFRYICFSRKRNSMYVISAEDIIIKNNKISSRKEKEYTKNTNFFAPRSEEEAIDAINSMF